MIITLSFNNLMLKIILKINKIQLAYKGTSLYDYAPVAELVDALDLGSSEATRASSILVRCTIMVIHV